MITAVVLNEELNTVFSGGLDQTVVVYNLLIPFILKKLKINISLIESLLGFDRFLFVGGYKIIKIFDVVSFEEYKTTDLNTNCEAVNSLKIIKNSPSCLSRGGRDKFTLYAAGDNSAYISTFQINLECSEGIHLWFDLIFR